MSILYERLSALCAQKGITGYRMAKDNQLSASLMTDLKMGRKKGISAEVANKLSNYFNVSVGYLLGSENTFDLPISKISDSEMNEMYTRIEHLCKSTGINVTQMCKDAKIARGNLTDLKMGRTSALSTLTLSKIAAYFNVSMEYLLGHEDQKEKPAPTNGDGLSPEDAHIMDMIRQLTPENKRKFAEKLEVLLEFQEPSPDSQA